MASPDNEERIILTLEATDYQKGRYMKEIAKLTADRFYEKGKETVIEQAQAMALERIANELETSVTAILEGEVKRVDEFGDEIGEALSLREMVKNHARDYLATMVTQNGSVPDACTYHGSGGKWTRLEYFIKKVVDEEYKKHLEPTVKKEVVKVREQLQGKITNAVQAAIQSVLKLRR